MSGLGFAVTVGRQSARWPAADGTLELLELECCTGVGGGWARLRLGPPQGEAGVADPAATSRRRAAAHTLDHRLRWIDHARMVSIDINGSPRRPFHAARRAAGRA